MNSHSLMDSLLLRLTPQFAILLLLTAVYSLYFCVKDAKNKNHRKAETAARTGGWLYAALAAAVLAANAVY